MPFFSKSAKHTTHIQACSTITVVTQKHTSISCCTFWVNSHTCIFCMHEGVCGGECVCVFILCGLLRELANHDSYFGILTASFHHTVSQSLAAAESQVPSGSTLSIREKCNLHTPSTCLFLFLFPSYTLWSNTASFIFKNGVAMDRHGNKTKVNDT